MFLTPDIKDCFSKTLEKLRLNNDHSLDKLCKRAQIFAYLEMVHAEIRHYSKKRELVFIDSGAGSCFLSFLLYHFYSLIEGRKIRIYCVDHNPKLMEKGKAIANSLGFSNMNFCANDIADFWLDDKAHLVYSLHACDSATDKTLHCGIRHQASHIFSVSCCQHELLKQFSGGSLKAATKHKAVKERTAYMIGDAMRGLLMEMEGYETSLLQFVSSRYTDKNIVLKAKRGRTQNLDQLLLEYQRLQGEHKLHPTLERLLNQDDLRLENRRLA